MNKLSKILLNNNVQIGDRVIIYMPMIPMAIISMMACWRIGAIHSVVFGGFASEELSDRLNDSKPKFVICASCGIEPRKCINYYTLVTKALKLSKLENECQILLFQRNNADKVSEKEISESGIKTLILNDEMNKIPNDVFVECKILNSNDILYTLYTSGTTGTPKGVLVSRRAINNFVLCSNLLYLSFSNFSGLNFLFSSFILFINSFISFSNVSIFSFISFL